MASELWGPASGVSVRRQEDSQLELQGAQTANLISEIGARPAQVRRANAEAAKLEQEVAAERAFASMAQGGLGPSQDIADRFDFVADKALKAGLLDKAKTFATAGADIRTKRATQLSEQAQQRERDIKAAGEKAKKIADLFGTTTSPAAWAAANFTYEQMYNEPSPYKDDAWSPELAKQVGQQGLEYKDAADLLIKQEKQKSLDDLRANREKNDEVQRRLNEERIKTERARQKALEKAGKGKGTKFNTRRNALNTIKSDWVMTDEEAALIADEVAELADDILLENPGMKGPEAVAQAYVKSADSFKGKVKNPMKGGGDVAAQQALTKKFGVAYDPNYEYKQVGNELKARKKVAK